MDVLELPPRLNFDKLFQVTEYSIHGNAWIIHGNFDNKI